MACAIEKWNEGEEEVPACSPEPGTGGDYCATHEEWTQCPVVTGLGRYFEPPEYCDSDRVPGSDVCLGHGRAAAIAS